jgi:hypothetical protein
MWIFLVQVTYESIQDVIGIFYPFFINARNSAISIITWFSGTEQAFASLLGISYMSLLVGSAFIVSGQIGGGSLALKVQDNFETRKSDKKDSGRDDHVVKAFKSLQNIHEEEVSEKDVSVIFSGDQNPLGKRVEELEAKLESQQLILKRITLMLLVYVAILGALILKIFLDLL